MSAVERPKTHSVVVPKKNFKDLSTKTFTTRVRGEVFQGFIVRKGEKYFAYQNLCRHLAITLDLNDNNFLTHDRSALQCHMHGAIYNIETGLCTAGPCEGASLYPLEIDEEAARLIIRVPDAFAKK